ncbi:MAG TPA: hypothetical protein VE673_12210 [Pseudonocardiaceae bacterium]|nr:hypothetical protein [Pseudonocardiaceae bacterium]
MGESANLAAQTEPGGRFAVEDVEDAASAPGHRGTSSARRAVSAAPGDEQARAGQLAVGDALASSRLLTAAS